MDSSASSVFGVPQLLFLAVAVTVGLVAIIGHWYRQRTAAVATIDRSTATPARIVYNDAPTVRVTDAQRVDRLRKIAQLSVGEHVDILETPPGFPPRLRITLKALARRDDGAELAQLRVEFGETRISCGPLVTELGYNEFEVPRAGRDEPRSALFHYFENGGALDFIRVKVRAVSLAAATAELDVMQVRAHWPAGL